MSETLEGILRRMGGVTHHAGAFSSDVLIAISAVLPETIRYSLETGCGKSTVMFSNISEQHYVFAYDDRKESGSSVQMVVDDPDYRDRGVTWVYGPTQRTLLTQTFPDHTLFDVVLLDGPHGYPFPDLEYALLYDRIRPGGVLIIDDVHIPSIGKMYDILREDRMYREIGVFSTTGVLQRTSRPGVPSTGDHWYEQSYNVARFPLPMDKYVFPRLADLGEVVDLTDRRRAKRHMLSGVEYVSVSEGVRTTDLSTVLRFDLTSTPKHPLTISITHKSCYLDLGPPARILLGSHSMVLEPSPNWIVSRFETPPLDKPCVVLEIEHPTAPAEHDKGNARYDFRRLGSLLRSVQISAGPETVQPPSPTLTPTPPQGLWTRARSLIGSLSEKAHLNARHRK